jgi:hypothetical protein
MFYVEQPPSAVSSHDSRGRLSYIILLSFKSFPYSGLSRDGSTAVSTPLAFLNVSREQTRWLSRETVAAASARQEVW